MGWIAFVLFIIIFFFGSGVGGGRMPCCGRPHAVPGSWNSGTHLRLPGAGPEGRSVSPRPGDPFPSSLRLFGVLGSILSEGRKAFADFEPPPVQTPADLGSSPCDRGETRRDREGKAGGGGDDTDPEPLTLLWDKKTCPCFSREGRTGPGCGSPGGEPVPEQGGWEVGGGRASLFQPGQGREDGLWG